LKFSLQMASPETFGYPLVHVKETEHLVDLGVNGMSILKWMFMKQSVSVWTAIN